MNKGVMKNPRSVTSFPMPPNVIKVVNAWGISYQKEEKENNNLQAKNKKKDKWKKSSEEFRAMVKMGTTGEGFGSMYFIL